MGAKRALIVDDSRSARMILARILAKHAIDVDSAESAEDAILYLASSRPDVIFMDHMMPGMDGLTALAAIKNNPRTATIPIMMYTSQSGDVYLGQARALGAVGVLPKQIGPADVSKVLQQLHLADGPGQDVEVLEAPASAPLSLADEGGRPLTASALREHLTELRRSLDMQTDRIGAELRAVLLETRRAPMAPALAPWHWLAAGGALLLVVVLLGTLWISDMRRVRELSAQLTDLQGRIVERAAVPAPAPPVPPVAAPVVAAKPPAAPASDLRPLNLPVPFGQDVMGGGRLDSVRQFLYRLAHDGVSGVVDIKTYAGRYCLMGNALDGFSLAPDDMPYAKCDVVGNPSDDALSPEQHTPLALANLAGEVRHATRGALDVQVSVGDAAATLVPYPVVAGDLTAGEWNRAGSSNNRVEVRVR
jgi:CheY-like chemotaxis protein